MSTVYIEWKDIPLGESKERYIIEMEAGNRVEGSLAATEVGNQLLLPHEDQEQFIDIELSVYDSYDRRPQLTGFTRR
jgi:hypothetical protein